MDYLEKATLQLQDALEECFEQIRFCASRRIGSIP
jgi:hypothetical protein